MLEKREPSECSSTRGSSPRGGVTGSAKGKRPSLAVLVAPCREVSLDEAGDKGVKRNETERNGMLWLDHEDTEEAGRRDRAERDGRSYRRRDKGEEE
ncbi:hypothetical protein WN48_03372 [Eufriesea mexicana]|uniref:Uncharacterized protein n=1 Tax=Eufriesea mexicana TaxID=516756 RepID=A0A310S7E0_9HYME|nr:hypothetical protein WN48_03372 [Eufriesea mexicana]